MTNRFCIGNAQTIGCREVQSNYFSTVFNSSGHLLAVLADGSIDHPNGRRAAILAAQYCVREFDYYQDNDSADDFFVSTAIQANRHVENTIFTGKNPRLSLSMAIFAERQLYYFSIGTNKFFLYDGHSERPLDNLRQLDDLRQYTSGKHELERKAIVGLLSPGAYEHSHPMERIKAITSRKTAFDKAQAVVESLNAKNLDNQLNTTVVLVEVAK